jgi:hypothetical protein
MAFNHQRLRERDMAGLFRGQGAGVRRSNRGGAAAEDFDGLVVPEPAERVGLGRRV